MIIEHLFKRLFHGETDGPVYTTLQTCGHFEYALFKQEMLPWLDLVMYDLKLIDPEEHLRWTGRDNKKILENFRQLLKKNIKIMPRIPLIPGFTTSEENLQGISDFLKEHGVQQCSLLPYNPLGLTKWGRLGKTKPVLPTVWMQKAEEERCQQIYARAAKV